VNDPAGILNSFDKITSRIMDILGTLTGEAHCGITVDRLKAVLLHEPWQAHDLPLLAAAEAALLDLLCRRLDVDVYELIGFSPKRTELTYGGVLPIGSPATVNAMLDAYREMSIPYLRIKLSDDPDYVERVLESARRVLGEVCSHVS
jgi:L-alanine-DL-glutamate epimerase-like enolase superfamily enzyme